MAPVRPMRYLSVQLKNPSPSLANDPRSVKVNVSSGSGVEIEWKDGHHSLYLFSFLRDACLCALCDDERQNSGRKLVEVPNLPPGSLPLFKAQAKALVA